jgi:hypothetical protein
MKGDPRRFRKFWHLFFICQAPGGWDYFFPDLLHHHYHKLNQCLLKCLYPESARIDTRLTSELDSDSSVRDFLLAIPQDTSSTCGTRVGTVCLNVASFQLNCSLGMLHGRLARYCKHEMLETSFQNLDTTIWRGSIFLTRVVPTFHASLSHEVLAPSA